MEYPIIDASAGCSVPYDVNCVACSTTRSLENGSPVMLFLQLRTAARIILELYIRYVL